MQIRKVVCMLFFFATVCMSNMGLAQDKETEDAELAELKQQVIELQQQMHEMKEQISQGGEADEVKSLDEQADLLRQLALEAAGGEIEKQEEPAEQVKFQFKGLNLRKLNPEISVSGDMVASFTNQKDVRKTADVSMRAWELNIQSYLDPFSKFKSTIPVDTDGNVEIEEMYFTRYNAFGDPTDSIYSR